MSSFRKRSPPPHTRHISGVTTSTSTSTSTTGSTTVPLLSPSAPSITATALRAGGGVSATNVIFDNAPFYSSTWTFKIANTLGFAISLLTGSHLHLDLIGTGAFAVVGIQYLMQDQHHMAAASATTAVAASSVGLGRSQFSAACVAIWGTKLAGFLFFRALQTGHDKRLDETLSTLSGTFGFWFISWIWGVFCSLPHTLGTTSSTAAAAAGTGAGSWTTTAGAVMYIAGLILETTADVQKWIFKQSNPGKFCNTGVWSISQHPNFFGNLLIWTGIFLINAKALVEPTVGGGGSIWKRLWSWRRVGLALLSPLFMWTLFSGQANGTITNAVELANQKYGADPEYQKYVAETPKIIPNIFKMMKPNGGSGGN